jgi:hypothetical protein
MSKIKELSFGFFPAKQLISDLHPFVTKEGDLLLEPEETISKLRAVLTLLSSVDDDNSGGLDVSNETVSWALILALDLVDEVYSRVRTRGKHTSELWRELESRLDGVRTVPVCGSVHADQA